MNELQFPDETAVLARGLHDAQPEPPPTLGLYLDDGWEPSWPAAFLDWPDGGTPDDPTDAAHVIRSAFRLAQRGERLEVGCLGGIGRTGTVLSCIAVLAGVPVGDAVAWVREWREAVETMGQAEWVLWFGEWLAQDDSGPTGQPRKSQIGSFADYLCLVYHEARNVRHLVKAGHLDPEPYKWLVSLPVDRDEAWEFMLDLRRLAATADTASAAAAVFADRFHLTLDHIESLDKHPHWKGQQLGGNRWASITKSVNDLKIALDRGDLAFAADLLVLLPLMRHNNGRLGDKLRDLTG